MKIVFFGSDDFSLSSLKACIESPHEVSLVVTTPPQKQGRGLVLTPSPVQVFAELHKLPFASPAELKDDGFTQTIRDLKPDLYVVASYGKFIPGRYLSLPSFASLNVHPSLVPLYRGSSPIQWPILNGDRETGLSIIEVAKKLDAGDVFRQVRIPLHGTETHPALRQKLAQIAHHELLELLNSLPSQPLKRTPQDESLATYARKLTKEDGFVALQQMSALEIDRKVRALQPWPGAFLNLFGQRTSLLETALGDNEAAAVSGMITALNSDGSISVAARAGILRIKTLQPAGKKPMLGVDYANGRRLKPGSMLAENSP